MTAAPTSPDTLVIHPGGALGDFVLTWPLVRVLSAGGRRLGVVAAASKSGLAARVLGVRACPDHLPPWSGLWTGSVEMEAMPEVGLVIAFGERPAAWRGALSALCPRARLVVEPRTVDRRVSVELALAQGAGPIRGPAAGAANGPVVLHVGAGGLEKQWPLDRWIGLAGMLRDRSQPATLVAGEAERERWRGAELRAFEAAGGRFVPDLHALVNGLADAAAVIAADTGPGHLAAQLGLPTLSLFGPTDPDRWAPIGARTAVVRAPNSRMAELPPDHVMAALDGLLAAPVEPLN